MRYATISGIIALGVIDALLAAGCATAPCARHPIVVKTKEERVRTDLKSVGTRSTATGGVEEVTRPVTVREYWVQSTDRKWHRITEEEYEVAAPNVTLDVCR